MVRLYELYEYTGEDGGAKNSNINKDFKYGLFKPTILRLCIKNEGFKQWFRNLYWFIISNGKFSIYYVYREDEIIHTSYCLPKCYKFPFMTESDIQIGPCNTNINYRGLGLYPYILSKIVRDYNNDKTRIFMIIRKENVPSQKGAMKIGFKKIEALRKNNFLKTYKI
ncbi:hypothetical protein [Senegalia sp. (in: firmicutes)]|uniref:hypothetical protein n=1 Tax=Senegalia sp. (in: firmicutes) TaxID=1924098 RepID=UPI003F9DCFAD